MAALVHRQGGLTGQSWLATAVTALRRGRPRWARDSTSVTRPRLRTAQYSHGTHSDSTPVRAGVQHSSRDRATDRTVRLGAARAAQHSGASISCRRTATAPTRRAHLGDAKDAVEVLAAHVLDDLQHALPVGSHARNASGHSGAITCAAAPLHVACDTVVRPQRHSRSAVRDGGQRSVRY